MLQPPMFGRFEDAYTAVLAHVSQHFEHTSASRGNTARECLNVSFVLRDPRDRIVYLPARRTNIVFCFAEALWYLWARDDLEMISYYAPRLARFSSDGEKLAGSAYGPKLFRSARTGRPQWETVRNLLAEDPASKRAVVSFFHPDELTDPANPDVSCTLALQFFLRAGHLHTTAQASAGNPGSRPTRWRRPGKPAIRRSRAMRGRVSATGSWPCPRPRREVWARPSIPTRTPWS